MDAFNYFARFASSVERRVPLRRGAPSPFGSIEGATTRGTFAKQLGLATLSEVKGDPRRAPPALVVRRRPDDVRAKIG